MGRTRSSRKQSSSSSSSSSSSLVSSEVSTSLDPVPDPQSSQEEDEEEEEEDPVPTAFSTKKKSERTETKKVSRPGIVYLSSIPPNFNVAQTTMFFSQFGKVGRVFLQTDPKDPMGRHGLNFVEGWVEFLSKSVAKSVSNNLNNTPVGGKKRSKSYDALWNIKYLHRFKWIHLTERLQYERNAHNQRMRTEIARAKREADFFKSNVDISKKAKKRGNVKVNDRDTNNEDNSEEPVTKKGRRAGKKRAVPQQQTHRAYEFRQKETDEAIRAKKRKGPSIVPPCEDEGNGQEDNDGLREEVSNTKVRKKVPVKLNKRGPASTSKKKKRSDQSNKGNNNMSSLPNNESEEEKKKNRLLKMFTVSSSADV